jgi:hypothetical protein
MKNDNTRTLNLNEYVCDDDVVNGRDVESGPDGCGPCRTAELLGWWADSLPRDHAHCSKCHATFPGSNRWGHCPRCHQTFSGVLAFDLHQRDDADGEFAADCMCTVLTPGVGETAVYDGIHQRKWAVSDSKSLVQESASWGYYWMQDSDISDVFAQSAVGVPTVAVPMAATHIDTNVQVRP